MKKAGILWRPAFFYPYPIYIYLFAANSGNGMESVKGVPNFVILNASFYSTVSLSL